MSVSEGSVVVDPLFLRTFARQVVIAARNVETPEDKRLRHDWWIAQRRRAWQPLTFFAEALLIMLNIEAFVLGGRAWQPLTFFAETLLIMLNIEAFVLGVYLVLLISPGILATQGCPTVAYKDRHSHQFYPPLEWLNPWSHLAFDHWYRVWEWIESGRTDIGGCWHHEAPTEEFTPPGIKVLGFVAWVLFSICGSFVQLCMWLWNVPSHFY